MYSINYAKNQKIIDEIFVSTDYFKILKQKSFVDK
tara:strand:- start:968 stop:1072 length:105 start_codon:yes stop_codon:yes gene_type:complete